jgi:TolC family type I secretion outer membrane protein
MRVAFESRLRSVTAATVAAVGLWAICAQPAGAQSLSEALAQAYATNPTLRAARAELRAVNEGVPQALSNWRPNLTVTGSAGKQHIDSQASFSSTKETTTPVTATAQLIQPLYRGGRTTAATERAEHEVRSQRSTLQSVEQSVLLRAVTAYMDIWRDQAVIAFNINNERVIERQLEATEDRFTVGEVTRTDVAQAETRLAVATADRIAAEGALSSSRAVYAEVIGSVPGVLPPPLPLDGLPANLEAVTNLAVSRNPDVLAASFAEKAARRRVREVIGELLPSVQINASLSHSEETNQKSGETDRAQILAEVTIPLYQQGAVSSRVREAKQITNQRRIEVEESRRRIEQEAISAWEGLQTARAQIRSFESGVRAAEIALEGVRQENAVGARTILDILDAEQELLDAKVSLVRSQRDEIIAGYQVHSAIGRLTARDLNLQVEVYNPEVDYLKVRNTWFSLGQPISGED